MTVSQRQAEAVRLCAVHTQREAAGLMGISERRVGQLLAQARRNEARGADAAAAEEAPTETRLERRDAAFWAQRAKGLEREVADLEHLLREVRGALATPVAPPRWLTEEAGRSSHSIVIVHTSDVHMGEVIRAGEIDGINAFDPTICRERMRRLFSAACTIPPRWMHDATCDGVLLTMGGDLTSGDIHEELSRTNALTSHEQLGAVVEVYIAGIRQLLAHYPAVHVVAVEGNHGRTTHKNPMKRAGALSYDTLAAAMVRAAFADEARVTFAIGEGPDVRTPVYGRTILTTHGHKMGTGGGMGFAGPLLPIVRGTHKVRSQSLSAGLGCDLILGGHFHTSANGPGFLFNGSVPGYSEYGLALRAAVEPPKQWLARYSMAWGLCERLEVQLEPRPARMRAKG